jgi:sulfate adenylyltransferase large subunit
LLFETESISQEEADSVSASRSRGNSVELSRLLDGLKDEREQGITIDVAYRHFRSTKRRFIIADCPGHFQYTKNLIVGAANSDIALVLIDVNRGVVDQTRRHIKILQLLQVSQFIFVINKMDTVNYESSKFNSIVEQIKSEFPEVNDTNSIFIPVSARMGDNVVKTSDRMKWYFGPTILQHLEQVTISSLDPNKTVRVVIQKTILDANNKIGSTRAYAARVLSGTLRAGDAIHVYPSKTKGKIKKLFDGKNEINTAFCPSAILLTLENDLDLERGSVLVSNTMSCTVSTELRAEIFWFDSNPISETKNYIFRHTCQESMTKIQMVDYDLSNESQSDGLGQNQFAHVNMKLSKPVWFESHRNNQTTGLFILIDPLSNNTVGVGLIELVEVRGIEPLTPSLQS